MAGGVYPADGCRDAVYFVRIQLRARVPMIDMRLFCHRIILSGVVMAMTAMIAPVGFELLMAQELQFVHGFTPFEAGMFMLPVMVASGFSGPIAGVLVGRLGLRIVAAGDGAERGQLYRPVDTRLQHAAVAGVGADGAARLQCRQRAAGLDLGHYGGRAEERLPPEPLKPCPMSWGPGWGSPFWPAVDPQLRRRLRCRRAACLARR